MKVFMFSVFIITMGLGLSNAQNVEIPDTTFLYALINRGVDKNEDSLISISEAEAVTGLNVALAGIHDMTGIEKFVNLDTLECYNNPITNLDVSNCTALKYLDVSAYCGFVFCSEGILKTLDVSNNSALEELYCRDNLLTSLDVSDYASLRILECDGNELTSLNVSGCTALTNLGCAGNELTILNANGCIALTELHCAGNQLSSLDISSSAKLRSLNCWSNQLSTLDLSNNPALIEVDCKDNQLTSLIFSGNLALKTVECENNQLTSLDVSNFTALQKLYCHNNELTHLDVSGCNHLYRLKCSSNQLDSLDVSSCSGLDYLDCSWNQLSRLYLTNRLTILNAGMNQLTSLDISKNIYLEFLGLNFNENLNEVCVWTTPFPPAGVSVQILGSPVCFETDCNGECGTTRINSNIQTGLSIYPNPTNNFLTIETNRSGQYAVNITSLNGQLIYGYIIEGPTHQIDLSSFQRGVYVLTIRSRDYVWTERIIRM